MNEKLRIITFTSTLILIIATLFFSCEKDTDFRSAEYPKQLIYMPAAYPSGQFIIDEVIIKTGEQPIDGFLYKYLVDSEQRKFHVPLSVYRSGVNNSGGFTVNIEVNNDTISALNETREISELLHVIPIDKYSISESIKVVDGQEVAKFDLTVDLDFLMDNYPNKVFALAINISSPERDVNPDLSTTIVIIHSKIMKPTADFTVSFDNRKALFINNSLMSERYIWDFGDGYLSDEKSPSHEYSKPGDYEVTLHSIGITGNKDKSDKTIKFSIY